MAIIVRNTRENRIVNALSSLYNPFEVFVKPAKTVAPTIDVTNNPTVIEFVINSADILLCNYKILAPITAFIEEFSPREVAPCVSDDDIIAYIKYNTKKTMLGITTKFQNCVVSTVPISTI